MKSLKIILALISILNYSIVVHADDISEVHDADYYKEKYGAGSGTNNSGSTTGNNSDSYSLDNNSFLNKGSLQAANKKCGEKYLSGVLPFEFNSIGNAKKSNDDSNARIQFNHCVSENNRMATEQQNAPKKPGSAPVYNCPLPTKSCNAQHEAAQAVHQAEVESYNEYLAQHANMFTAQVLPPSKLLEDIQAKQQIAIDRLERNAKILNTIGTGLVTAGGLLLLIPLIGTGPALAMIALGIVFKVWSDTTSYNATKLAREKAQNCEQMNKIVTKKVKCEDVKEQNLAGYAMKIGDNGSKETLSAVSSIPNYIDKATGTCKKGAPIECTTLVKTAPAGCFKQGGSCLAALSKKNLTSPFKTNSSGKVVANINGKERAFGLDDFQSVASMTKAGFTPAQANEFFKMTNDKDGLLNQLGLNAKGELKSINSQSTSALPSSYSSGAGASAAVKDSAPIQKDEYVPSPAAAAAASEVARAPSSTEVEGATKNYKGEKIGVSRDDLFNMVNRRYNLKQQQNLFIGE